MQSGFVGQEGHSQVGTYGDRADDCAGVCIKAARDIERNSEGGLGRVIDPLDRANPFADDGAREPNAE